MPDAKTIPIIAMSANTFEQDVAASLASGMNAHLPKPVEPEKLYTVLSELIIQARNIKVNA
jgi:CheY-like chemotaxis protein